MCIAAENAVGLSYPLVIQPAVCRRLAARALQQRLCGTQLLRLSQACVCRVCRLQWQRGTQRDNVRVKASAEATAAGKPKPRLQQSQPRTTNSCRSSTATPSRRSESGIITSVSPCTSTCTQEHREDGECGGRTLLVVRAPPAFASAHLLLDVVLVAGVGAHSCNLRLLLLQLLLVPQQLLLNAARAMRGTHQRCAWDRRKCVHGRAASERRCSAVTGEARAHRCTTAALIRHCFWSGVSMMRAVELLLLLLLDQSNDSSAVARTHYGVNAAP